MLLALLAAVYLAVGFSGEIACAQESLFGSVPISISTPYDKADESSKKTSTVVEHCYSCAPATMPLAVFAHDPGSISARTSFGRDTIRVFEARLPEPPPPKYLN